MKPFIAETLADTSDSDWETPTLDAPGQQLVRSPDSSSNKGSHALPDIQSRVDHRGLSLDAVGVKGVRYPLSVRSGAGSVSVAATLAMTVGLPAASKGTHMSRFIELLEEQSQPLSLNGLRSLVPAMLHKLDARSGEIHLRFPYFIKKVAPVSGVASQLDYDVCWTGRSEGDNEVALRIAVSVPATSLCPCSKEISAYGAHNQRSCIYIEADIVEDVSIEELVRIAERSASSEVYGLLKRDDEKFVTERAYDNPKFVEDLVRDVALALDSDTRIKAFVVEAENFESIHNHSAYARIAHGRTSGQY